VAVQEGGEVSAAGTHAKECAACWKLKPLECFTPLRNGKHGVHAYCKPCKATIDRASRVRLKLRNIEARALVCELARCDGFSAPEGVRERVVALAAEIEGN
jgi:hypothetical protein